ncbi:MAG: hypothetical protein QXR73_02250 [Candidatus Micrarchaeaceae archaeon]
MKKIKREYIFAAIVYLIIAFVVAAPITTNITTTAPGIGGDTYQNLWDIWWVVHAVTHLHTIWNTNALFYPIGANLIFQTMSPLGALVTAPFQAISIPFAYNVMLLLGYVISGICMYVLAKYVTHNAYASFIAGLVFTFSAFHVAQSYAHIDWVFIGGVPLALYFFLRMLNDNNKYFSGIGLGITLVFTVFMGDIEQGVMLLLLLVLIGIAYLLTKETRRRLLNKAFWASLVLAIAVALTVGAWGFIPLIHNITVPGTLSEANYLNTAAYNELWSMPLGSFFIPSYFNGIFNAGGSTTYMQKTFGYDPTERTAYVGYTVIALAIYGVYKTRKLYKLWLGILIIFGWLSLGPLLQVGGAVTHIPELYLLYHALPVLNIIREPGRFILVFSIAAAIFAAIGAKSLLEGHAHNRRVALMITLIITVLFVIEVPGIGFTHSFAQLVTSNAVAPKLYSQIAALSENFSMLILPAMSNDNSSMPNLYPGIDTYYSAVADKPLVGGDLTRFNNTQQLSLYNIPLIVQAQNLESYGTFTYLTPVNESLINESMLTLYNSNTTLIAINRAAYTGHEFSELLGYMEAHFGSPIYSSNTTVAFSDVDAINASIYKSYVTYPYLSYLSLNYYTENSTTMIMWLPNSSGCSASYCYIPIQVYAPYKNATDINSKIHSSAIYTIPTKISFNALAIVPGTYTLIAENYSASSYYAPIARFNVTTTPKHYSFNTTLVSGPYGNQMLFVEGFSATGNETIAISNITFSRN